MTPSDMLMIFSLWKRQLIEVALRGVQATV